MKSASLLLLCCVLASSAPAAGFIWGSGYHEVLPGDDFPESTIWGTATVHMSGGEVYKLACWDSSVFTMTGGTLGSLGMLEDTRAHLYGGSLGGIGFGTTSVPNTSEVHFYVRTYEILPGPGAGILSGTWADGASPFNVSLSTTAMEHITVHIIPEPSIALLVGVGLITTLRRKRRARTF